MVQANFFQFVENKNLKVHLKCIASEQANILQTETNFTHIRSLTIVNVDIVKSAVQKSDVNRYLISFVPCISCRSRDKCQKCLQGVVKKKKENAHNLTLRNIEFH